MDARKFLRWHRLACFREYDGRTGLSFERQIDGWRRSAENESVDPADAADAIGLLFPGGLPAVRPSGVMMPVDVGMNDPRRMATIGMASFAGIVRMEHGGAEQRIKHCRDAQISSDTPHMSPDSVVPGSQSQR